MSGFLLVLVAVLLSGTGARDQMTVASLTRTLGARPGVLLVSIAVSCATAAFAGWAAALVAPLLSSPARIMLSAMALGFAGLEALVLRPGRDAQEATYSLGALAIVLTAHQLTDAARFLIFGIAVAASAPLSGAIGGAVGGALLLGLAWAVPELFVWRTLRWVRWGIGAWLLVIALYIGLGALA